MTALPVRSVKRTADFSTGAYLIFALVENTSSEMSRLIFDMAERLSDKEIKATSEQIEEALNRIEESEALESEVALWQVDDPEKNGRSIPANSTSPR